MRRQEEIDKDVGDLNAMFHKDSNVGTVVVAMKLLAGFLKDVARIADATEYHNMTPGERAESRNRSYL